jgi:hypothetical protein
MVKKKKEKKRKERNTNVRELTKMKNVTDVDNVTIRVSAANVVRRRKVYTAELFFFLRLTYLRR